MESLLNAEGLCLEFDRSSLCNFLYCHGSFREVAGAGSSREGSSSQGGRSQTISKAIAAKTTNKPPTKSPKNHQQITSKAPTDQGQSQLNDDVAFF